MILIQICLIENFEFKFWILCDHDYDLCCLCNFGHSSISISTYGIPIVLDQFECSRSAWPHQVSDPWRPIHITEYSDPIVFTRQALCLSPFISKRMHSETWPRIHMIEKCFMNYSAIMIMACAVSAISGHSSLSISAYGIPIVLDEFECSRSAWVNQAPDPWKDLFTSQNYQSCHVHRVHQKGFISFALHNKAHAFLESPIHVYIFDMFRNSYHVHV
jgi:hypothetical protein